MAGVFDFLGQLGNGGAAAAPMQTIDPNDAFTGTHWLDPNAVGDTPSLASLDNAPMQLSEGNLRTLLGISPGTAAASPPAEHHHGIGGVLRDFLGTIGDSLLAGNGMQPIYRPYRQQKQVSEAVSQFLGPDTGLQDLARRDPGTAISVWRAQQDNALERAKLAAKPTPAPDIVVIDGIAFDKRTGDPLFESPYPKVYEGPNGSIKEQPRIGLGHRITQTAPAAATETGGLTPPQILESSAQRGTITPEEAATVRSSLGPNGQAKFDAWLNDNNISIAKNVGGTTYYQIGGRWFDNPEGH